MPVRLFLISGEERIVPTADAARVDGAFFAITRRSAGTDHVETVLTLRTQDVIFAEIVENDAVTDYVLGGGRPK